MQGIEFDGDDTKMCGVCKDGSKLKLEFSEWLHYTLKFAFAALELGLRWDGIRSSARTQELELRWDGIHCGL